jgi:rod shape determining protein RodA
MSWRELFSRLDWVSLITTLLLVAIGLAMLFSASYQTGGVAAQRFLRQGIAAALGFSLFLLIIKTSFFWWRRYAIVLYVLSLGTLAVVGLTAGIIRGTASRFSLFGFQLQPSELMKVSLIVLLAYLFYRRSRALLLTFLATLLPVTLLVLEPDLGMAFLLASSWVLLLIFVGLPWRTFLLLGLLGLAVSGLGWRFLLANYQKERLIIFLDPAADPLGAGYNISQSLIAFGSGQITGRGLGHGPQSRLQFLPEQHTDFIFASIGEELGFLGISIVIILYALLLFRTLRTAQRAADPFARLLTAGVFCVLLISFTVSAGMNIGLLPVTGLPFPLVSYGGSNLITTWILLGIVQSVEVHSKWSPGPLEEISYFT